MPDTDVGLNSLCHAQPRHHNRDHNTVHVKTSVTLHTKITITIVLISTTVHVKVTHVDASHIARAKNHLRKSMPVTHTELTLNSVALLLSVIFYAQIATKIRWVEGGVTSS